jgi:hypothetical protein
MPIDDHVTREDAEIFDRASHRQERCLKNIEPIDFTDTRKADTDVCRGVNLFREFLAALGGQKFRIGNSANRKVFRENDCGCEDWTC